MSCVKSVNCLVVDKLALIRLVLNTVLKRGEGMSCIFISNPPVMGLCPVSVYFQSPFLPMVAKHHINIHILCERSQRWQTSLGDVCLGCQLGPQSKQLGSCTCTDACTNTVSWGEERSAILIFLGTVKGGNPKLGIIKRKTLLQTFSIKKHPINNSQ